jgi:hypothetical protein
MRAQFAAVLKNHQTLDYTFMIKLSRLVTLGLLALSSRLSLTAGEHLYLLSGVPSVGGDFPVSMYSLDAIAGGSLTLLKGIGKGLSCVLADYEHRRLVVASPGINPTEFSFINMNEPTAVVVRHLPYDSNRVLPIRIYLLDLPQKGPGVAMTLGRLWTPEHLEYPSGLTFAGLKSPDEAIILPFSDIRYFRWAGFIGGAHFEQEATVEVRGDPLRVPVAGGADTSIEIPRPNYQGKPNASYLVVSNDDARLILIPYLSVESGVMDIFSKTSKTWRRAPLPFQKGPVRLFGSWLAMAEQRSSVSLLSRGLGPGGRVESPGARKRQSELVDKRASVDDNFEILRAAGKIYPGELAIYNLDQGTQLRISTGSGDSEVVLATDEAVYYRVDDELYRRRVIGTTLGPAVKLAEGPEIVGVHWAFVN